MKPRDIHSPGGILFERVKATHKRKVELQSVISSHRFAQSGECEVVTRSDRETWHRRALQIRWRIQLQRESLECPCQLTPRGCIGAKHSFAQGRERRAAAAFEHDERITELAMIGTQESPCRAIGQATISDRGRKRTRLGDRS
jgi:hypothetical protein